MKAGGRALALLLALTPGPTFGAAAPVPEIVQRAERQVSAFLDVFSDVKCTERVRQMRLRKNGKAEAQEQSIFDYLVIAQNIGDDVSLHESRLEQTAPAPKKRGALLVTNGFATLLLIFHPEYAPAFQFVLEGEEVVAGRRMERVRFTHVHGQRTPMVLMLRGREYPLELQGTAWIDADTAAIARVHVELQDAMDDIGLHALTSDVTYGQVHFHGGGDAWLPDTAVIDVETPRQHWRNVHQFTNYQRFSVDTLQAVKAAK